LPVRHHFADLRDPRRRHGQRHRSLGVTVTALCAVVAGANTCRQVETFAQRRRDWLARFLELPNGAPCGDARERAFGRLDPLALQRCLLCRLAALCDGPRIGQVASGGEAARRPSVTLFGIWRRSS
jgi:hypothetical protein